MRAVAHLRGGRRRLPLRLRTGGGGRAGEGLPRPRPRPPARVPGCCCVGGCAAEELVRLRAPPLPTPEPRGCPRPPAWPLAVGRPAYAGRVPLAVAAAVRSLPGGAALTAGRCGCGAAVASGGCATGGGTACSPCSGFGSDSSSGGAAPLPFAVAPDETLRRCRNPIPELAGRHFCSAAGCPRVTVRGGCGCSTSKPKPPSSLAGRAAPCRPCMRSINRHDRWRSLQMTSSTQGARQLNWRASHRIGKQYDSFAVALAAQN